MKKILCLLFIGFYSIGFSQFNFTRKDSIKIVHNTDTLANAWSEGFNNPQFSSLDINQDGIKDVFVFDRSCNEVRTFVYKEVNGILRLIHEPSYEKLFPRDSMRYRTALVDYNCDGKEDLFTYFIGGIRVFKNTSNPVDGLQWELAYNHILSDYNGSYTNAFVSSADIPAITDVDLDGDIDILSFDVSGELVHYHKNLAQENFNRCDTLVYEVKNYCWGKFREDLSSNTINLNDTEQPCNGVNQIPDPEKTGGAHVGSTVLALDIDASGVMDLVLGDATFNNLVLLTNSGNQVNNNSAMVSFDVNFPSNTIPADVNTFPASFYLDLDNDGIKDLVVAPNYKGQSNNVESAWWYKNNGANNLPDFEFQSTQFLQEEMIDVGSGSIPTFVDENADGLMDLVVSNFYELGSSSDKESKLSLYRNVGSPTEAIFKLEDENYLDIHSLGFGLRTTPYFEDLDNDGDIDLLFGNQSGTVVRLINSAGANNPLNFSGTPTEITDNNGTTIDVGTYSSPFVIDMNKDNQLDLVVGDKLGFLSYFQNTGTNANPIYTLITENLGNVDTSPTNNEGYSQPYFVEVNDTLHLFCGARDGYVHYYKNIEDNLEDGDNFDLVSHQFLNIHSGTYSSVAIKNVSGDNKLELLYGSDLGGLAHYEGGEFDPSVGIEDLTISNFSIYPNPNTGEFVVSLSELDFGLIKGKEIQLISADGRIILKKKIQSSQMHFKLNQAGKGIYFVQIGNSSALKKIIVQ